MIMTILVLVASCVLGYTMVYRQFVLVENQFTATGSTLAAQLSSGSVELVFTDDQIGLRSLVNSLSNQPSVVAAAIINRDRAILAHSGHPMPASSFNGDSMFREAGRFLDDNGTVWFHAPVTFKGVIGGAVWVGMDKSELNATQKAVIRSGIIVVALLVISITLVAIRLGQSLGRPIYDLIQGTRAIEKGHFGYRIRAGHKGEFKALTRAFNNMAAELEQKIRMEHLFSRFVSNPVAARYMLRDNVEISREGKRVDASVIFVDLVDYTVFSEGRRPEEVAQVLNLYFTIFADTCHRYNGNVDKFIGDCAMLVFGCPQHDPDHRYHAMMCAIQIRKKIGILNQRRRKAGLSCLEIRIGISGGVILAGLLGSHERLQYTVIGKGANLASRLCSLAKPGQIMTDKPFFMTLHCKYPLMAHDSQSINVKGFQTAIDTLIIDDWIPPGEAAAHQERSAFLSVVQSKQ